MSMIMIEIIIIVILTLINGLLAMAEFAIVSSRKARLQQIADSGSQSARSALQIVESPGDFLSTVQVGITLIGILAGAFGGITIAEVLAENISHVDYLAPYSETLGIAIVVLGIGFLSLIFGELVPKRIALSNPERISSIVALPMRVLSKIASPAVKFLSLTTNAILWALRVKPAAREPITEEEVRILIRQGTITGVFEREEQEMIDAVFRVADRRVSAIMTPRKEITAFETGDSVKTIHRKIKKGHHSHYPLCEGGLDNILGMVSIKDILMNLMADGKMDLRAVVTEIPTIPAGSSALAALGTLKRSEKPVGLVIDEFGGLVGIVTMKDFASAIVGVLRDIPKSNVVRRQDGSWLVDGLLPFDDLIEIFPALRADDQQRAYATVGGFVVAHIGRIPKPGDAFDSANFRFEVMDMDGLRVDKVLVTSIILPAD